MPIPTGTPCSASFAWISASVMSPCSSIRLRMTCECASIRAELRSPPRGLATARPCRTAGASELRLQGSLQNEPPLPGSSARHQSLLRPGPEDPEKVSSPSMLASIPADSLNHITEPMQQCRSGLTFFHRNQLGFNLCALRHGRRPLADPVHWLTWEYPWLNLPAFPMWERARKGDPSRPYSFSMMV